MPIKLPHNLPAYSILEDEGVMVMGDDAAQRQDIRPLKIGLLNLMPLKIQTETQFARLIGATPLQIELTLIRMSDHQTRNTSSEHMEAFYRPFSEVNKERFDGLIITGAPVEHLAWHDVHYWDELSEIFEWTRSNVFSTLGVCWGAMAMINYFHGIQKHMLTEKAFGCFRHRALDPVSPYLRGFSDDLLIPVSRWTELSASEIEAAGLKLLISSEEVGPCLIENKQSRDLYMLNHLEYDSHTLDAEYRRDLEAGGRIEPPLNYYPENDPSEPPTNRWRSHAHLFYGNWINQLYQHTEFRIDRIEGPGLPRKFHSGAA